MQEKELNKIAEVLLLSGSNLREETIERYIEHILHSASGCKDVDTIIEFTKLEFDIVLNKGEVDESILKLKESNRIINVNGNWVLSDIAANEYNKLFKTEKERDNTRKTDFINTINNSSEASNLNDQEIELLFKVYKEYIIECIYSYGRFSTLTFSEKQDEISLTNDSHAVYNSSVKKLKNTKLKTLFKKLVSNIPDQLTSREVNFIEQLSSRAENFYSLGLSKQLAESFFKLQPFEWTILLDTNVLYSILRIREHPENIAISKLLEIFVNYSNNFRATLRFLPETSNELKKAKNDLNNRIIPTKLSANQLRAALLSNNIDDFTKAYYNNMLVFGEHTQHPSSIIDHAVGVLSAKKIESYRLSPTLVDTQSEAFKDLISAYNQYHLIKNEAKQEKGLFTKEKYIDQIEHDVYLREVIIELRKKNSPNATHFQDCKYFAFTLDKNLINFDRYYFFKMNKGIESFVPVFFMPSVLLKRIYKFVPVETDDYKKAFISSITQPVFSNKVSNQHSRLAQNALKKFYALGIDDPTFILKSITNDVFLKKLDELEETSEMLTFIESEMSKQLTKADQALNKAKKELSKTQVAYEEKSDQLNVSLESLTELAYKEKNLSEEKSILYNELKKVKTKIEKQLEKEPINIQQTQIPFEKVEYENRISELKGIIQQNIDEKKIRYINQKYNDWKYKPVYWLIISLFLLVVFTCYLLFQHNWDPDLAYSYYEKKVKDHPYWIVFGIIGTGIMTVADLFIIKEIQKRWHDHKNIESFKKNLDLPKELKNN